MALGRKKICKVISFILMAFLVFSSLFAYFFYLDLKKTVIVKIAGKASSLIGQQVDIGDMSLSAVSGINLQDITIQNPAGFVPGQLLKIKRIAFNLKYRDFFEGKIHFSSIGLYAPELTVMKDSEGRLNISDGLRRFLSKKGTLNYQVDELKVQSGIADFNNDIRLRNERINLSVKNLSSGAGAQSLIEGNTVWSGENRVTIKGWANLRDEPKKFRISVSAETLSLSPFTMILSKYHIDAEKTKASMHLDAVGDTDNGVDLASRIEVKSPGYDIYKKALLNITMDLAAYYDIAAHTATINTLSLKVGDSSALHLKGRIADLPANPVYDLEGKIASLDLSAFNVARGFSASGVLSSDSIHIKGGADYPLPALNGSIQLQAVSFGSADIDVKNMNGRMIFSSANDITASLETSAELLNVGGHALTIPSAVRLSVNATMHDRGVAVLSSLSASPIAIELGEERKLFLGTFQVLLDGMMKGNAFTGVSSINAGGGRYNDYAFERVNCRLALHYDQGGLVIKSPRIETEEISSSADFLKIKTTAKKGGLSIAVKNLSVAYPVKKTDLSGLDFSATLNTAGKMISGDMTFSAAGVMFRQLNAEKITGSGKFNERAFSLLIPKAEFAGGRITLIAHGKTFQEPFPVTAEIAAEQMDLGEISAAMEKQLQTGYPISGTLNKFIFHGTINSKEVLYGNVAIDLKRFSALNKKTERFLLKDALIQSDIALQGKDCAFTVTASAGTVATTASGTANDFLSRNRSVRIKAQVKEAPVSEIRNSFWDVFPDSLLYAGMDGSVASDIRLDYENNKVAFTGELKLKNIRIEGENGEYAAGPVNGVLPFAYGTFDGRGKTITLPSFEQSEFDTVSKYYADEYSGGDDNRITIGSLQYGFRLLEDLNVWLKQDRGVLNVGRFSANIFGGRLNGSALIDFSDGLHYRGGMILEGMSLTQLCDDIEPIKGYISGKVDGIGTLKGSGTGLSQLLGKVDLWTYGTKNEKTRISREFLQKIGGPSIKSYLGDRNFDKGIMSVYLQKGFLVFKEMEISNRNIFGIQDLSVKVAPLNNRIAIDHLMWTIVQAADRAKKNNE